ncbi:neuferricin isoform X2 [Cephus cinctus]|uniref:Neuferricin isoform X2 n=1 Tax=Cephus cinctus TaxID=211228 RepID=A0AAJ7FRE8_CEPCN|nr:neuferricin isoform X2 [Cephus cinctus]
MLSQYLWISLLFAVIYMFYSSDHHRQILIKFLKENVDAAQTFFMEFNGEAIRKTEFDSSESLFTTDDLKRYNNLNDGLYLSVLGQIYDVTKGEKHYGKGAAYNAFVGRDASLAFVTGDFTEEGLIDDISSLSAQQTKDLYGWIQFYKDNYVYKGKLIGRYYDEDGNPTSEFYKYHEKLKIGEQEKSKEEEKKRMFPPCNIEWKIDVGTRVWCTKKSGGIERNWVGVPRMFYENPGSSNYRCACVNIQSKLYNENKGSLREYAGCAKGSTHCTIKQTEDTV